MNKKMFKFLENTIEKNSKFLEITNEKNLNFRDEIDCHYLNNFYPEI